MAKKSKSGGIGARKREKIRKAAYECFRDHGYHETSVDAICTRADISKGGYYWHYDSKQAVFVDILEVWSREVMDELLLQFEAALDQDNYAQAIAAALAREFRRGRHIVPLWLEFTVHARREEEIRLALARFFRRARAAIQEILLPSMRGRLSEADLQGLAATIFGAYAGLMMQDICDPDWANASEASARFMSVIGRWLHDVELDTSTLDKPTKAAPKGQAARVDSHDLTSLLANVSPDNWTRIAEVRDLVIASIPHADERVITGWRVVAYDVGGLFCFLKARPDHLRLGFYNGVDLADPNGVLEGAGKRQRHVVVPYVGDLQTEVLQALLLQGA